MSKVNIYKALANFQQEVPCIHKDTQGYGYTYADLPKILEVINPLLKKHGLGFSQPIQGQSIETIIYHIESGEEIKSLTEIPQNVQLKGMNDFQVLGSAITYLRRYALSSLLGLVTDKDIDASGEQKKSNQQSNSSSQNQTKELPWLNVFESDKKTHTKQWNQLTERINKGESIEVSQLRNHFKISKEVEAKFNELKQTV